MKAMKMKNTFFMFILVLFFVTTNSLNIYAQKEKSTKSDPNTPIFEIKNDLGQTVFAVYPGGVKIFVDDQLKAAGGGFTVGRLSTGKAVGGDILSVSPGNVNIYLDTASTIKAAGGGFTVGRLSTGKKALGTVENFLTVTPDSTRVYIDEKSTAGFAVGRVGNTVGKQNFLYLKKDNYFIGQKSGERTTGLYNLFLGYESGFSNIGGTSNTFLGFQTGYLNTSGNRNVFIGDNSGYSNTTGNFNTFIGTNSGVKNTVGNYSTFLGYQAGREVQTIGFNTCIGYNSGAGGATGNNRAFLGYSSGATSTGDDNTYLGAEAGYYSDAGAGNVYIGTGAGRVATGSNNILIGKFTGYSAKGSSNVLIGPGAGWNLQRSNILIIDNSSDTLTPLIYGEFNNKKLRFEANVGINADPANAVSLYVDAGSNTYAGYFNGNVHTTGNYTSSDIRWKKNIRTIDNSLNRILNLRGVYYDWRVDEFPDKGFSKEKQIGVIAQEVEKVLPELVNTDNDGYKAVAYDKLTAVLIEAVKEQQKQIELLKNENKELSSQVADLSEVNTKLSLQTKELDELRAEVEQLKSLVKEIVADEVKNNKSTESAK